MSLSLPSFEMIWEDELKRLIGLKLFTSSGLSTLGMRVIKVFLYQMTAIEEGMKRI